MEEINTLPEPLSDKVLVDELIDSLWERGYAVLPGFLNPWEVESLLEVLHFRQQQGQFKKAGIGHKEDFQLKENIRGDEIFWIEPETAKTPTQAYLEKVQHLIGLLNRYAYLGLQDAELHFAHYPAGTFYKRHLDQFQNNDNRRISCICYLNKNWQPTDGGQLRIYIPGEEGETAVNILPEAGKLVLLRSEMLEHEVVTANRDRYSITGWLLDKPKKLAFLNF